MNLIRSSRGRPSRTSQLSSRSQTSQPCQTDTNLWIDLNQNGHVCQWCIKDKRSRRWCLLARPSRYGIPTSGNVSISITNNVAEYEALPASLKMAKKIGIRRLTIHNDSQLFIHQGKGSLECKDPTLEKYLKLVQLLTKTLKRSSFSTSRNQRTQDRMHYLKAEYHKK